jgi:hypothetical protein
VTNNEGAKYIAACATPSGQIPTKKPPTKRLRDAVVAPVRREAFTRHPLLGVGGVAAVNLPIEVAIRYAFLAPLLRPDATLRSMPNKQRISGFC